MLDNDDRRRTGRTRTWAWGGILGLLLTVWVATATWAFDDAEPAEVGLHGILAAEVPEGLTGEAFSVLDGNWEKWSTETAEIVTKLYEDDSLDLAAQKEAVAALNGRIGVMEKALADKRYRSIFNPLNSLHGRLSRRITVAEAVLEILEMDPNTAHADRLNGAKKGLSQAVSELESDLNSVRNGSAWLPYLKTGKLKELSAEEATALAADVLQKLKAKNKLSQKQQEFLNRPTIAELERSLANYLAIAAEPVKPVNQEELREALSGLVAALEEYELDNGADDALEIAAAGKTLQELSAAVGGRMNDVIRVHYRNYNLRMVASESFLRKLIDESRTETGPVDDYILSAKVDGTQTTDTKVGLDLKPRKNGAKFHLTLNGVTRSNTQGVTEDATIFTHGTHSFWATKEVTFDGTNFATRPAKISVNPNNNTVGARTKLTKVPILGGFADSYAKSAARKKRPESEAIAAQRVSSKVLPKFNKEVDKTFTDANTELEMKVRKKLADAGLMPDAERFDTSETELRYSSRVIEDGELGGGTRPLSTPGNASLVLYLHESLLNNAIARMELAGKTMTEDELGQEFEKSLTDLLGKKLDLGKDDSAKNDGEKSTFVFDKTDAIRFRIDDGSLILSLRTGLKREGKEDIPTQRISVPLNFVVEGGNIVITAGTVKVTPVNRPESLQKQIARAGIIRQKIKSSLPERKLDSKLTIKLDEERSADVSIISLTAEDGWLTIRLK